jgi:hypothetical protein
MSSNLVDLFISEYGTYNKYLQFEVIVIIFITMIIFTTYFDKTYAFVIILLSFALFIANSYIGIKKGEMGDFNEETMYKLNILQDRVNETVTRKIESLNNYKFKSQLKKKDIQKLYESNQLDCMYIDANMIHFLYSIEPLYEFNDIEFTLLLKGTNNILRIRKEIEEYYESNNEYTENITEMLEMALLLKSQSLNNVHNFIYSIPKMNKMYTYIDNVIDRYNVLISRNIDIIHNMYKQSIIKNGVNTSTKFISYNKTKPYDSNVNFDYTRKNQDKIVIPFYY